MAPHYMVVSALQMWSGLKPAQQAATSATRSFTRRSRIVMMPEGPEVRTLVDQLQPSVGMRLVDFRFLSGRYVQHDRPKGFEDFAKTITPLHADANESGSKLDIITKLECKGKFIYLILDKGHQSEEEEGANTDYQRSIWITLGMTGQFANEDDVEKDSRPVASNNEKSKSGPRWYMQLLNTETKQARKIFYRDMRNFGTLRFCLSETELNDKLASLGPDLLDFESTTEEVFLAAMEIARQNRNICKFLMDQSKVSGVGLVLMLCLVEMNYDFKISCSLSSHQQLYPCRGALPVTA